MRLPSIGRVAALFACIAALAVATAPASAAIRPTAEPAGTPAMFEGSLIDMSLDWGEATACMVWPDKVEIPECFRTEAERDERVAELDHRSAGPLESASASTSAAGPIATASATSCSGYLKLYDGTSYTGASLWISGRLQWFDLSSFNFNQRTSSFKIGPCSAYFADYAAGGGAWYPTGSTQAYDVATSMASGWNNDVSSLYIT